MDNCKLDLHMRTKGDEKMLFVPEGVNSAMMTAFTEEGAVNELVMRQWVDFMIEKGINGLFPASSIGEFIHMSVEDCYRLTGAVVEQAAGRVPVFPGVCSASTDISIKLAKYAEKKGCQAVVALPPYYSAVSQTVIQKHFEKIAASIDIGLILYNIPSCTTPISRDTVKELLKIPNIVAIKDSSANMVNLMHLIELAGEMGRDDFGVLTGWDDMLYPALCVGARGCMSGVSGVLPEISVAIYKSFKEKNYEKALKLQQSLLPVLNTMSMLQFPAGYKMALDLRGFSVGSLRQPIEEADPQAFLNVRKQLQNQLENLLNIEI